MITIDNSKAVISVYIINALEHKNGNDVGVMLELPASQNEIQNAFNQLGIEFKHENYMIDEYTCIIKHANISQYATIEHLNSLANQLTDCDEDELKAIDAYCQCIDNSLDEAIYVIDIGDYEFFPNWTMIDLVHELIDTDENIPKYILDYIDYEKYAQDLIENENYYEAETGVIQLM